MLTRNIEAFRLRIAEHAAADLFIGGEYYNRDTGQACFIGCHVRSNDPGKIVDIYGIPVALTRIAESIFEAMPTTKDKTDFAVAFGDAVGRDGKDLSLVHWAFLAAELRAIPATTDAVQAVINSVIEGMDLLASGQEWPADAADAAYATADAADAAYATADAADATADAAARAADAARAAANAAARATAYAAACATAYAAGAAARLRQRDTLLALCNAAIANPPATTSPHKPPFDKPRNHDEEIANVKAGRDWYKAQKGITE